MNLPPRQRMARELRERCRQLPGGSRLDTVRKLMEEYTTSQRTVEQVLNELAADGLLVRRPGSGWYVRDNSAEKVRRYLLIFPAWPSPNYRELESEFRRQADGARFKVDTVNLNYDEQFFRNIRVESYDAVIVTPPAGPLLPHDLEIIFSWRIPAVLLREIGDLGLSMASGQAHSGGALAASRLISAGHRKLALLLTEPEADTSDARLRGFLDFARYSGAEVAVISSPPAPGGNTDGISYRAIDRHLKEHGLDFTALFLQSAAAALEVYKVFSDHGVRIPDDVSLIAHDNVALAGYLNPPLTCIGSMSGYAGTVSGILAGLDRVLKREIPFFHLRDEPKLVERKSIRNLNAN
ncbi:GntR family transcriptional regulator [uncultured Victivallis sp.]|uniref:GntR family transcriptional regulator n=1 Tax=uncultured Victivallis sp. TaxID=354118 RepID=UPI00258EFD13|nr:GntR family transcriptional regulator [uncultured Victivallis sp.]